VKSAETCASETDTADAGSRRKGGRHGTAFLAMLFSVLFFLFLLNIPVEAKAQAAGETPEKVPEISSVSELNGKKVGVFTGTILDQITQQYIKDPKIIYYDSIADCIRALEIGKIDGFLLDDAVAKYTCSKNPNITTLPNLTADNNYAYIFQKTEKGDALRKEMNVFLQKCRDDGTLKDLEDRWTSADADSQQIPDPALLSGEKGTLHVAADGTTSPFCYYKDNNLTGYDIELLEKFCRENGYGLEFKLMDASAIISSIISGRSDIGAGGLSITEERKQSVYFSDAYYNGGITAVVRCMKGSTGSASSSGLFSYVSTGFVKTFIQESRWKMVVSGLFVTIRISILAAIFGTLFGFIICMARRSSNKLLSGITAVFIRIVQGIPMLVLLMVLYYIIFASFDIAGEAIAVIGFSVNFGVYVSEMMRTGIEAVDKGQWEAAATLGFSRISTFVRIIAPQAMRYIIPVYKGELISMVKMTSVVGYIAIQDLTKISDIIRSRTYDAFFPLIATAVIYFLISWGMTLLLGKIETEIDPLKRKPALKGVDAAEYKEQAVFSEARESTAEEVIRIEHLKKEYPDVTPLKDVNAVIRHGEVITVIGPSGTGKSTLLRNIIRLERPTDGKIYVFGKDMDAADTDLQQLRMRMGMVFQSFNLFPHLTVIENIMLAPVCLKKVPAQDAYNKAMSLLTMVGLSDKALSYPAQLSGGQKQRVAIARTMAMDPEIILFDEPTSALDPTMVGEVLSVIRNLAKQGMTMMIVTHEMKFARKVSTRIFYMDEGIIYEDGTPEEIFDRPQKEKTRQFVNHMKVFRYEIRKKQFDFIEMDTRIENFARNNAMSLRMINGLHTILEELCLQTIIPKMPDVFEMTITNEVSEDGTEAQMEIIYDGPEADCLKTADPISAALIRNAVAEIRYSYKESNRYAIALRQ
jgi:His/Glu/Gln/Arg/opine family amino acid ABC transporter permease subunit